VVEIEINEDYYNYSTFFTKIDSSIMCYHRTTWRHALSKILVPKIAVAGMADGLTEPMTRLGVMRLVRSGDLAYK